MNMTAVADLVSAVRPFSGQDLQIVYHVYTDLNLNTDATISSWTLTWTLFSSVTDASAILHKTPSIVTPLATVTLSAAELASLVPMKDYGMQLWRNESGNLYPLTGISKFTPQYKPPLT